MWIPLVDTTEHNGCMHVLPKECDPLFSDSDAEHHMECATIEDGEVQWAPEYEPFTQCAEALPAPAGSLITWADNLIHWSASCRAGEAQPRISIATTFYRNGEGEDSPQGILYRHQLHDVDLRQRLQIVAKAMIMYHHWHPGFAGFPEVNLRMGAELPSAQGP